MKRTILIAALALLAMPVLIGFLVWRYALPNAEQPRSATSLSSVVAENPVPATGRLEPAPAAIPMPAPAARGTIIGEKVSLEEARRRAPFAIPMPTETITEAQLLEVWASEANNPPAFRQVQLIYSNGLNVFIGGRPERIDYGALAKPPARPVQVNGIPASGKDPTVQHLEISGRVDVPGVVSWWANGVDIHIWHPSFSMDQLLKVANSMPIPTMK